MTHELTIRLVRALPFQGGREWRHHDVVYPFNTVYFVTAGDGHIRLGDVVTQMRPGWAYLIPPHCKHDVWCDTRVEKVYAELHAELLPGYDVFGDTRAVLSQELGQERCEKMRALCSGGMRERLMLRGELNLVLASFMQEEPHPVSAKMAAFLPMITYMQENLSAQLRREELAARFGWTPSVLSRSFKRIFGCGPKQYMEKLLITRLAEELALTDKTLQQLADQYGFCDGYYLSAYFKRGMGVSPQDYRRRNEVQRKNESI